MKMKQNAGMSFIGSAKAVIQKAASSTRAFGVATWTRYRGLRRRYQIAIPAAILIVAVLLSFLFGGKGPEAATNTLRTVTVKSVGELTGTAGSVNVIGNVRSVSEAQVLAQSGGTVRAVHTSLGRSVPAGFVIAELENASERAVVLQAQGAYEAALAARSITLLQAGNTQESLGEAEANARITYRSTFTTIDSTVENYADPLLSGVDRIQNTDLNLREKRDALAESLRAWRYSLETVDSENPEILLTRAENTARLASEFFVELSRKTNSTDSGATATQKAGVATARASIDGVLATLSTERDQLRAARTAANVSVAQSSSNSGRTASADASVKQALGSLRLAQANLEKTFVRAPIAGTVNFLPIRVGDYVTSFTHVTTIANNGSLEVVAYVSESERDTVAAGAEVMIEEKYPGIVTSIAPALDPSTKRIEVRIAVSGDADLVNGQSVRVALGEATTEAAPAQAGPLYLPLASVKLRAEDRIVFTVGEDRKLVAVPVTTGDVRGDRIEITSALPSDVRIVTDARGLAEGQEVAIAE